MSTKKLASSPTARKVVGSLGVIGGCCRRRHGHLRYLHRQHHPGATTIQSGTLSIDVTQPGYAVPVTTTGFVPGDSMTRAVNLINDGTSALGSVTLARPRTPSILTTDATNGLQLAVKSCSVAWTQGGTPTAPTYTCAGTERLLGSGPVVNNAPLTNPASLVAGGTDYLAFAVSLPRRPTTPSRASPPR